MAVEEEEEEVRQGFDWLDSMDFLECLQLQGRKVDSARLLSEPFAREHIVLDRNLLEEHMMTIGKEAAKEGEEEEGKGMSKKVEKKEEGENASEKEGGQGMDVDEASEVEFMVNTEKEEKRERVRLSRLSMGLDGGSVGVLGKEG